MFKVPSTVVASSSAQQPDSSNNMSGKRRWQDAFCQQDSAMARETMLGLSCGERPQQRPKVPQLTIFYAGAVNVYDNVPEDMVRALMILAAAKSSRPVQPNQANNTNNNNNNNNNNSTSTSTGFTFPVLSSRPTQPDHKNSSSSNTSTSTGFKFQVLEQSSTEGKSNSFRLEDESMVPKAASTGAPLPVVDVAKIKPKMQLVSAFAADAGLPQARRASIQRFLEKRKQKQINNSSSRADEASVKQGFFEEAPAAQFSMRGF